MIGRGCRKVAAQAASVAETQDRAMRYGLRSADGQARLRRFIAGAGLLLGGRGVAAWR
jgi:hypothetical protein